VSSAIDYLFDVCNPATKQCSGGSHLENLFEWGDAGDHLEHLAHADPQLMDDDTLLEVKTVVEIYLYLIPEMMRMDADDDDDDRVVYQHSAQLMEKAASISDALAQQHVALEVELIRRSLVVPDDFWNAYVNFFPCEDGWEWPEIGERSNLWHQEQ